MPLTVLQTLPALETGGVERGTVDVAAELARRGQRALVISGGGALTGELDRTGARHHTWPIGKKSPFTLLLARRLRRFLQQEKVDILHASSRLPAWVAYLAWSNMPADQRPAFITSVHGPYRGGRYSAIMTRGQRVIAISRYIYEYILAQYPETDPGKITIIPRGVDAARFSRDYQPEPEWLARWRQEYPQLAGKALITLPGRITRWKGHTDFIEIIARLKQVGINIHGLIAGDAEPGRQRFLRELMRTTAKRGLEGDISFLGRRSDLREVLCVSAVALSLANAPEAFGRTALEALSLGRPVVAYAHGGAREVLQKLQPDGLVMPGSVGAAVDKIRQFLKTPPPIARNQTFTLQQMLDQTLALYEQACSGNL